MSVRARVSHDPIDPGEVLAAVGSAADGAVLLFLGTVRDRHEGARVEALTYEAYESMATRELAAIAGEAAALAGSDRVAVVHRLGPLAIGDVSVAIAISTPHRAEAFAGGRYVIEEIKKRLPVWKREHYVAGDARWVDGVTPPVPEPAGE
ncbi:MAG TPA: molybdenum cofactor biosynthesis protein MoaE [Longimicrobiales bacterium]|nr:molybdenum cofactor biosynthesis protein MoaE [Longimicrobiales bacterium]